MAELYKDGKFIEITLTEDVEAGNIIPLKNMCGVAQQNGVAGDEITSKAITKKPLSCRVAKDKVDRHSVGIRTGLGPTYSLTKLAGSGNHHRPRPPGNGQTWHTQ